MFKAKKGNLIFLILTTFLWLFALGVAVLDFILIQEGIYYFNFVNFIGLSAVLLGVILRIQARRTLSEFFSPFLQVSSDHQLITRGIYKYLRHPAYLGSLLISLGIPLVISSFYGFLVMFLVFPPCILYRIKIEEQMLVTIFGNEYLEYCKKVKKLIPYIY